jgi:hypothetical protein
MASGIVAPKINPKAPVAKAPAPKPAAPKAPPAISGGTKTPTKTPTKTNNSAINNALSGLVNSEKGLVDLLGTLANQLSGGGTGSGPYAGNRSDADYASGDYSGTSNTGQHYILGKLATDDEWQKFLGGGTGSSSNSGKATIPTGPDAATQDAFAALGLLFQQYGLEGLSSTITSLMTQGLTAGEATIKLKYDTSVDPSTGKAWNSAYTTRFSGNTKRVSAGLNALSEAEYLTLEDSYANTLKSYGLGSMLSTSRATNEATFAKYIGADVSAPEFKDRIATVEDRVVNADPTIKETFKAWYPSITDSDLVQYFLDPATTIGKLKEKATAAEIGAAAKGQNLTTSQATAEGLAAYGIDRAGALTGYASIGSVLPTSEKLSNIYQEAGIKYDQASGESEFFKSNADVAEQRRRLKSMERAQFQGDSGINTQMNPLGKSIQGKF